MQLLVDKFRALPDYRQCKQIKFNVGETLFLALLAMLAGANGYKDMESWIKLKKKEIRRFLGRPFIAPADNTIRNVFLNIDTHAVETLLQEWAHSSLQHKSLNIVAADGKTMRGSHNRIRDIKARHIVTLFEAQTKIAIAQKEVEDKSNEIPALMELLDSLELQGCIITLDAMHTQKNSAEDCPQGSPVCSSSQGQSKRAA